MSNTNQNYQYVEDAEFVGDDIPAWKMLEKAIHQMVVMRKHEESLQEYAQRKQLYE